jgi:membrane protein
VVLIWVYYSAQLVLMGAEFTSVYASRYGSRKHASSADRQSSQAKAAAMKGAHPA